jgi:DNA-binding MarR family transcriptional regulator
MRFYADGSACLTQNDLVAMLQIDKGNVSRSVAKLVEKNYLLMREDGSRSYALTDAGRLLKQDLVRFLGSIHRKMVVGIPPEDLRVVQRGLLRLLMNLEAER